MGFRRRVAFTLIEMLVVIGIIAVLVAILYPVFARVREASRKIDCLARLQQLSTALRSYSADHSQLMVNWCVSHPAPSLPPDPRKDPRPVITWDVSIADRLSGGKSTLTCVSNPLGPDKRAYAVAQYTQRRDGINYWGLPEGSIPDPAQTVLLFEKGGHPAGDWNDAMGQNVYESSGGPLDVAYHATTSVITNRAGRRVDVRMFHLGGKNMLFVDGSARHFKAGEGPFATRGRSVAVNGIVAEGSDLPWPPSQSGGR